MEEQEEEAAGDYGQEPPEEDKWDKVYVQKAEVNIETDYI